MKKYSTFLKTIYLLGLKNVGKVFFYRVKLKAHFFAKTMPIRGISQGDIFTKGGHGLNRFSEKLNEKHIKEAEELLEGYYVFFFSSKEFVGSPPEWHYWYESHEFTHWSKIPINAIEGRDVKKAWDLSRCHWAVLLAAAYAISGNEKYRLHLNSWLSDWMDRNPVNSGVNWVCAQETSIRLLNILNASSLICDKGEKNSVLLEFVLKHCSRIYKTLDYAAAQDNNHGVSESAALYIAGCWLMQYKSDSKKLSRESHKFLSKGKSNLEKMVSRLIASDGGFSMYSLNYHRMVMDTLSIVEYWRLLLDQKPFSEEYRQGACRLTKFLYQMLDLESGDVPNVGANDGSRPYLLTESDYRDFRPSVHLAAGYFCKTLPFNYHKVHWFNASLPSDVKPLWSKSSQIFSDTGFVTLVPNNEQWALIKFPAFKFRPSHSDSLHLDLWWKGENILLDSGSFSYNCNPEIESYFSSSLGHNTIQFDSKDHMLKLGKFLWGGWPKLCKEFTTMDLSSRLFWSGCSAYYSGSNHHRKVSFKGGKWLISDKLSGKFSQATLRWHLKGLNWVLKGSSVELNGVKIMIKSSSDFSIKLSKGWRSLYYGKKEPVSVIEVSINSHCRELLTTVEFLT